MKVYDKIQNMSPRELAVYLLDEVVNGSLCLKCSQADCHQCDKCNELNEYDVYEKWLLSDEI